jgi:hypothetical protein
MNVEDSRVTNDAISLVATPDYSGHRAGPQSDCFILL